MSGVALAIERAWYSSPGLLWLLAPLELVFAAATALRRWLFRSGVRKSYHPGCAVIVVGNITAGGSGKTPVVEALAVSLAERGVKLAVVSRGYGSKSGEGVVKVEQGSDASAVGDEPLMLARSSGCPVYIGKDRVAAARAACADGADVVVCDDGLQHYRLKRDVEILVSDARAPVGNGHLLPVGPLREGPWRFDAVDFVLEHAGSDSERALLYTPRGFRSLASHELRAVDDPGFGPQVHALAAIARPQRFFSSLRALGFDVQEHLLQDHSEIRSEDLIALQDRPLVITSKDAPKFPRGAHSQVWVLEMDLSLPNSFMPALTERLARRGVPGL